jgi:hypothetical protein
VYYLSYERRNPLLTPYTVPEQFWILPEFPLSPDDEYEGEQPENPENRQTNDETNSEGREVT